MGPRLVKGVAIWDVSLVSSLELVVVMSLVRRLVVVMIWALGISFRVISCRISWVRVSETGVLVGGWIAFMNIRDFLYVCLRVRWCFGFDGLGRTVRVLRFLISVSMLRGVAGLCLDVTGIMVMVNCLGNI